MSVGALSRELGNPVAGVTGEIAGGAPGPGWSFKIDTMPAKQDGEAEGQITVLKKGVAAGACKLRIKLDYTTAGITSYKIQFQMVADESKRGGFDAKAAKVETAIQNAFQQFAKRELGE